MKILFRSLSAITALGLVPLACEVHDPDVDAVQQFCAQAGWAYDDDGNILGNYYEFEPMWRLADLEGGELQFDAEGNVIRNAGQGSFEEGTSGALIVDDDDLTDDFLPYEAAIEIFEKYVKETPGAEGYLEAYANADPNRAAERTAAEEEAANFIQGLVDQLFLVCPRFAEDLAPAFGDSLYPEDYPYFQACKDRFNESGDGVIGAFALDREGGQEQDRVLMQCPTTHTFLPDGTDGRDTDNTNNFAMNFWGPLTTRESQVEGLPNDVIDGFTFSGLTVSVHEAPWKGTSDLSEWDGVAFWARLASPEEAVAYPGDNLPLAADSAEDPAPAGARPQQGVGQLGVSIQTLDTASVFNAKGGTTEIHQASVCTGEPQTSNLLAGPLPCFETQAEFDAFDGPVVEGSDPPRKYALMGTDGAPVSPGLPYCADYVPNDVQPGDEPSYRDHCWDGFRTMQEITPQWQFYFFPFEEMRQAGWGRVAETFSLDHIKSISLLTSAYQPINVMVDEISFYRAR